MSLTVHAHDTNASATQIALAAQDLRDRSMQGIHPTHDELVKLLAMARNVAYHAARTLYAANRLEQRRAAIITLAPNITVPAMPVAISVAAACITESEGGHVD